MIEDKTKHSEKEIFILSYYEDVKHYLYMFGLGDRLEDAGAGYICRGPCKHTEHKIRRKDKALAHQGSQICGLKYLRQEKNAAVSWYDMEEYLKEADKSGEPVSESQLTISLRNWTGRSCTNISADSRKKERKVIVLYYTYGYRLKEIAVMIRESETNTKPFPQS